MALFGLPLASLILGVPLGVDLAYLNAGANQSSASGTSQIVASGIRLELIQALKAEYDAFAAADKAVIAQALKDEMDTWERERPAEAPPSTIASRGLAAAIFSAPIALPVAGVAYGVRKLAAYLKTRSEAAAAAKAKAAAAAAAAAAAEEKARPLREAKERADLAAATAAALAEAAASKLAAAKSEANAAAQKQLKAAQEAEAMNSKAAEAVAEAARAEAERKAADERRAAAEAEAATAEAGRKTAESKLRAEEAEAAIADMLRARAAAEEAAKAEAAEQAAKAAAAAQVAAAAAEAAEKAKETNDSAAQGEADAAAADAQMAGVEAAADNAAAAASADAAAAPEPAAAPAPSLFAAAPEPAAALGFGTPAAPQPAAALSPPPPPAAPAFGAPAAPAADVSPRREGETAIAYLARLRQEERDKKISDDSARRKQEAAAAAVAKAEAEAAQAAADAVVVEAAKSNNEPISYEVYKRLKDKTGWKENNEVRRETNQYDGLESVFHDYKFLPMEAEKAQMLQGQEVRAAGDAPAEDPEEVARRQRALAAAMATGRLLPAMSVQNGVSPTAAQVAASAAAVPTPFAESPAAPGDPYGAPLLPIPLAAPAAPPAAPAAAPAASASLFSGVPLPPGPSSVKAPLQAAPAAAPEPEAAAALNPASEVSPPVNNLQCDPKAYAVNRQALLDALEHPNKNADIGKLWTAFLDACTMGNSPSVELSRRWLLAKDLNAKKLVIADLVATLRYKMDVLSPELEAKILAEWRKSGGRRRRTTPKRKRVRKARNSTFRRHRKH
jgi:hypothetical protein